LVQGSSYRREGLGRGEKEKGNKAGLNGGKEKKTHPPGRENKFT